MTGSSFRVSSSSRGLPALHPSTTLDLSHNQASCNRNPSILITNLLSASYQSGSLLVNRVGTTWVAAGMPCHGDRDGCPPSIQLAASFLAGSRIVDADVAALWEAPASSRHCSLPGIRLIGGSLSFICKYERGGHFPSAHLIAFFLQLQTSSFCFIVPSYPRSQPLLFRTHIPAHNHTQTTKFSPQ